MKRGPVRPLKRTIVDRSCRLPKALAAAHGRPESSIAYLKALENGDGGRTMARVKIVDFAVAESARG
jgi:hypothetical protein